MLQVRNETWSKLLKSPERPNTNQNSKSLVHAQTWSCFDASSRRIFCTCRPHTGTGRSLLRRKSYTWQKRIHESVGQMQFHVTQLILQSHKRINLRRKWSSQQGHEHEPGPSHNRGHWQIIPGLPWTLSRFRRWRLWRSPARSLRYWSARKTGHAEKKWRCTIHFLRKNYFALKLIEVK